MKTANLPEKQIENTILNWLAWRGVYSWKVKTTGTYDSKRKVFFKGHALYRTGVSDIIGILPPNGRLFAIEVKSKKGIIQPNQKAFLEEIAKRGGLTLVARSLDDVEKFMKDFL